MKIKKSFFDLLLNLIIIVLLLSNVYIFYLFEEKNIEFLNSGVYRLLGIFLLESFIILILINKFYINPINTLNFYINDFLSGKIKGEKIKIKTNYLNPNIKRILKFFDVILNSLKNIKDEFLSGKAIKSEVQLATELQEKLLNKKFENIPSLEVIAKSVSAAEIGGDSYDIIKQEDNYYIYVGDATGHGVGAGFIMVMVNALISGFTKVFKSGAQIIAHTNEILKPRVKSNLLMSLLMVRWNENEKRLFMSGAGHEYLIIYKNKLKKCFSVRSGGVALGMTKNIHNIIKESEIKFEENDIVVLYTDGITESINQRYKDGNEQMFGESRLIKAVEEAPEVKEYSIKTARSVFNNITIELSKFLGYKNTQLDDITLVVIHYKGNKEIENDYPENIPEDFITEWNWGK